MPTGTLEDPSVFGGCAVKFDVRALPNDPDGQVQRTINLMRHYAIEDAKHPFIQEDARRAAASDPSNPLRGVWNYVKSNFQFSNDVERARVIPVNDPSDIIEVIVRPVDASTFIRTGARNQEDCDGYSTYLASLLIALGYRPAFVTVAGDPQVPNDYTHVYVAAYGPEGLRTSMDASHGKYFGWEAPEHQITRKTEWPVVNSMCSAMGFVSAITASVIGYLLVKYVSERHDEWFDFEGWE